MDTNRIAMSREPQVIPVKCGHSILQVVFVLWAITVNFATWHKKNQTFGSSVDDPVVSGAQKPG